MMALGWSQAWFFTCGNTATSSASCGKVATTSRKVLNTELSYLTLKGLVPVFLLWDPRTTQSESSSTQSTSKGMSHSKWRPLIESNMAGGSDKDTTSEPIFTSSHHPNTSMHTPAIKTLNIWTYVMTLFLRLLSFLSQSYNWTDHFSLRVGVRVLLCFSQSRKPENPMNYSFATMVNWRQNCSRPSIYFFLGRLISSPRNHV